MVLLGKSASATEAAWISYRLAAWRATSAGLGRGCRGMAFEDFEHDPGPVATLCELHPAIVNLR